ncbi:MAG: hypothetical protein DRH17_07315 [Deltaproteobacteria bacterium]|nr:MAG: hypothetical protein DRH17_07315 [Deltaproteobacteria bacterium]
MLFVFWVEAVSKPFSLVCLAIFDRPASRYPRPLGRGQGELFQNVYLLYREALPFSAGGGLKF